MAFIDWQEDELVNVKEIDTQHLMLAGLVNELSAAVEEKKNRDYIASLIQEVLSASIQHFSTEESLMQKFKYNNTYTHKIEHDRCLRKIKEFQKEFYDDDYPPTADFLVFLKNWLINHVDLKDKKLGIFLNEIGLS